MAACRIKQLACFRRYPTSLKPFSFISTSPFITSNISATLPNIKQSSPTNHSHSKTINEQLILKELSDLLPIKSGNPNHHPFNENARVLDGFLTDDDKLRGVFIQNLNGKAAIEAALTATGVVATAEITGNVVNRGNLGGESMVVFFDWAFKQPRFDKCLCNYQILLKALGRRKYFGYMEGILHRMNGEGIRPSSETLSIVMDSFIRANQVSKAVLIFGRLQEFGSNCDCQSFNVLLQCLCRRARVRTANSLFNTMKGRIPFDNTTYNTLIGGWSKIGGVSEVDRVWKTMVEDGFQPDLSTFSYLLEGLGRAGRIDDAVEIFESMDAKGYARNTVTYNTMICNFISIGDLDACIRYCDRLLGDNCEPDMDTFMKLIGAFLKARRVADALETFDKMVGRGMLPNAGIVTSFVEPLCKFGPPHAALMIYKKARNLGCEISLKTYKLLIMRLARFGKCGMVLKVWEEMQESGHSSDMEVYEYIVNGLCNIGQVENAALVMEEALSKGFCPGKIIYSKLNNKLLNADKVDLAYKIFLKVKIARRNENARRYWRSNGWHF